MIQVSDAIGGKWDVGMKMKTWMKLKAGIKMKTEMKLNTGMEMQGWKWIQPWNEAGVLVLSGSGTVHSASTPLSIIGLTEL